jgi:hypothetical protein
MTMDTAPNAQAWPANEATPLGPFVARLDGDRADFAELARGRGVLVVETTGTALNPAREAYPRLEEAP